MPRADIKPEAVNPRGWSLNEQERKVLHRLMLGQSLTFIADAYRLSRSHISYIRQRIYAKLDVETPEEFRKRCIENGWQKRPEEPERPEPLIFDTIEGAAGPQARFLVGSKGDAWFFRFVRPKQERKASSKSGAWGDGGYLPKLDQEYTSGYVTVYEQELMGFRRIFPTYPEASRCSASYRQIGARVVRWGQGYLMVTKPYSSAAATLRLSNHFIMERVEGDFTPAGLQFLLEYNPEFANVGRVALPVDSCDSE